MRRQALLLVAAGLAVLAMAPAAHAGGGCTGVSVKGPKAVPEGAGTAQFVISADSLPVIEPPPPDSSPPPNSSPPPDSSPPPFDPFPPSDPISPPPNPGPSTRATCFVTVDFATADGTAQAGQDYAPVSGSVDLDPGQEATVDVPIVNDASDEPDEDFSLQTNEGSASATIVDDDVPPTLSVAAVPVVEGATAEVFTVTLSAPSAFPVSASYATTDGTAKAGSDYTATSGTVTFPPGTTKQIVSVPLVDDRAREGDESFALVLSAPQGAAIGAPTAPAVIHDNDAQGPGGPTGPNGPSGPTLVPAVDKTPPKITVPPGKQTGNAVTFTVTCPSSEQLCSGRVRLDLLVSGKGARAAATPSLGSATYRLKGGQKKKIKVKLNQRGKKLLKQRKKLRVRATFRTRDTAGNVATTSQIITLHAGAFRHS